MKNKRKDNKKYLKYAAIALVVVFLVSLALLFLEMWEKKQGAFPEADLLEQTVEYNGAEYVLRDGIETFLIIGLDKFDEYDGADSYDGDRNDKQADFLLLYVFDNTEKKYSAIHINRDTVTGVNRLDIAGNKMYSEMQQIALAHTYGNGREVSCRNVSDAVSELLLGARVNHYVSLTMDAVPIYNDLVGGVSVTVLADFSGIDDTLVEGETVTLMGEQALTYVRTRRGLDDSTNSTRMERQRQYLDALRRSTEQKISEDDGFIAEAALKLSDYIVSDRSVTQLQEIARKISTYEFGGIVYLDGDNVEGERFMEFYPDSDSLKKTVVDHFYKPKD